MAQRVPGGLGSQISWHSAREGGEVVSPTHRPPLPPVMFLVLIFTRGWVDPRAMVRSEGNMSLKNPVTPPGIDPRTVRLVAQGLNHYVTPGPKYSLLNKNKIKRKINTSSVWIAKLTPYVPTDTGDVTDIYMSFNLTEQMTWQWTRPSRDIATVKYTLAGTWTIWKGMKRKWTSCRDHRYRLTAKICMHCALIISLWPSLR